MLKLILPIFVLLSLIIFIQCQSLRGLLLNVTTILDPPYVMLRHSAETNITGNNRFEGYVVDLLDAISTIGDFEYVLELSDAGTYGGKDETGKWNGMIGELIDGKTHIAAGAITITAERESVIDFTVPFMNLGIGVLYKKEVALERSISDDVSDELSDEFEWLLEPFKNYITDAFLILTVIFGYILILLCRTHKTIAFRILLGFWLLFLLFFTSLFIAQLSSYKCINSDTTTIAEEFRTIQDFASQYRVACGCIAGGSTQSFFRNSQSPIYKSMWYTMNSRDPTPFVRNNTEGVKRVLKGNYAFVSESTMIEYVVSRHCNLKQIGGLLDSKGYGFAVQDGKYYIREMLNHAILVLQENGTLSELKNKWWFERNGGATCN